MLFTGPMGAGKTTAIRTLSEIEVISTEAVNSEQHLVDKPTTTVALDYGEIVVGDEDKIRMYGTPGQQRFDFMWTILKQRAIGMLLLVNNDTPDPVATAVHYLNEFADLHERGGVVVCITRSDITPTPTADDFSTAFAVSHPGYAIPIFTVDPREKEDMNTALLALIINIETRAGFDALKEAQ